MRLTTMKQTYSNIITKTCLFKHTENFITKKWKFSDKKNSDIFHVSFRDVLKILSPKKKPWKIADKILIFMTFIKYLLKT